MTADDTPWLSPAELGAWVGLIKLSSRLVALSDGELHRRHGITGRDYELLHHLSAAPEGQRVTDLASVIDDSSSCITHRVNRLVRAGLVEKAPDPDDRRARLIRLTEDGRQLLSDAAPDHVRRVRRWVFDALGAGDVAEVARLTSLLNGHLRQTEPVVG